MCVAWALFACLDTTAKYLGTLLARCLPRE